MKKLKVAVIGAGSTYTPEMINGFLVRTDSLAVDSLYMMDIDPEKNRIVCSLAERMLRDRGYPARLVLTESLEEAVEGADYVLGQVRVGKLDARIKDEKIPLKYDMLGQETTGVGGFLNGLRTIPVLMNVAKTMESLAPDAWLINFSNPSGIVAHALLNHTNVKAIGLCNLPRGITGFAKGLAPEGTKEIETDYVGINHLSWITAIYADGKDILPEHLLDEAVRAYTGILFDEELMRSIGAIPCGYLNYYYLRGEMIKRCKEVEKSRGEVCKEIERDLLKMYSDPSLVTYPDELNQRGGGMYSEAAVSLIESIENNKQDYHIINTLNKGAYDFMADDDVVEVRCRVGKNGVFPEKQGSFNNQHIIGMMQAVKAYERLAVEAGLSGNVQTALMALLTHPLIGDYEKAKPMLDEMLEAHRAFLPQFFKN